MSGESTESSRPGADEIYERVKDDAREELDRSPSALGFSGLLAGFTLGATPLAYAAGLVYLEGSVASFVAALVYPVGYIAVILGRAQLFTENTLYPVVLTFSDKRYLLGTARLWVIVLAANLVGALLIALLLVKTGSLPEGFAERIVTLGDEAVARDGWTTFWSAVLAGWLLAMVAWLVEATQTSIGAFAVIWILTAVVGLGELDHSVASAIEVAGALFEGRVALGEALAWEAVTVAGNAAGGVLIVSLVNFGQVRSGGG